MILIKQQKYFSLAYRILAKSIVYWKLCVLNFTNGNNLRWRAVCNTFNVPCSTEFVVNSKYDLQQTCFLHSCSYFRHSSSQQYLQIEVNHLVIFFQYLLFNELLFSSILIIFCLTSITLFSQMNTTNKLWDPTLSLVKLGWRQIVPNLNILI